MCAVLYCVSASSLREKGEVQKNKSFLGGTKKKERNTTEAAPIVSSDGKVG